MTDELELLLLSKNIVFFALSYEFLNKQFLHIHSISKIETTNRAALSYFIKSELLALLFLNLKLHHLKK